MADGADKTDEAQKAGEAGNAEARAADFDAAQWHQDLLALNPWARGLDWQERSENFDEHWTTAFAQARRQAMLARWGAGKESWNAWAKDLLALKARLAAAGLWQVDDGLWSAEDRSGPEQQAYSAMAQADFDGLCLPGVVNFFDCVFPGPADFSKTQFGDKDASPGHASFAKAQFSGGNARFDGAQFSGGNASFDGAQFSKSTFLNNARFLRPAQFRQAVFDGPVNLTAAQFEDSADFTSIHSKVGFDLTDARFKQVPSFIQASFHQPPRLDNVFVADPVREQETWDEDPRPKGSAIASLLGVTRMALTRDAEDEAKYRVLRSHAISAQDHERELEFHAQEIRCRRFWTDRPWGRSVLEVIEDRHVFWSFQRQRPRLVEKDEYDRFQPGTEERDGDDRVILRRIDKQIRPAGSGKFWFGWLYGGVSNFGRSLITPAATWAALIAVFTLVYFSMSNVQATPEPQRATAALFACPAPNTKNPAPGENAWPVACPVAERVLTGVGRALASPFAQTCLGEVNSSPFGEAFSLSLKNAFVFIDWDRAEAVRRTYGCLYGFTFDHPRATSPEGRGNTYPIVPLWVSALSLFQNIISAILIFLFLLALRNLLKLK